MPARLGRAATAATTVTVVWLTPAIAQADPGTPNNPNASVPSRGVGNPANGHGHGSSTRGPGNPTAPPTATDRPTSPGLGAGNQAFVPPLKAGVARGPRGGSEPISEIPVPLTAMPQAPAAPVTTQMDPVTVQIMTEASATEQLGEQLKQLDADAAAAATAAGTARRPWDIATAQLAVHRQRAREIAADAYKGALALGPLSGYANDLQELGAVAPAFGRNVDAARKPPGRDSVQFDVARAEALERTTREAYEAALLTQQNLNTRRAVVKEQFDRHTKALAVLRERNKDKLPGLADARDNYEAGLGGSYAIGGANNGYQAGPKAISAVQFALRQVGKPYVWAAEGPNAYDCSGLTYAAYGSVGISIPRVSYNQYAGLQKVQLSQLLPGDLLFFSTDPNNWRKIHHVAMYIGNGKMVHAPTFGDHVRVAPIWWSEYYGAARVVDAVPVAGARPTTGAPTTTSRPPTTGPRTTAPTTRPGTTTTAPTTTRPSPTPPVTTRPPVTTAPPTTTVTTTTATTTAASSAAETSEATRESAGTQSSAAAATSGEASPRG
ncbi:C40 family peptidase [Luedemannella flava]|uniref:C40 family peptidase n=1 Tax=Luedemannella flava TaxID=349316 RepID=UPI0031D4A060